MIDLAVVAPYLRLSNQMKPTLCLSRLTRIALPLLPALLVFVCVPCKANVPTPPAPPPTPAGYCQTINTELTNDLNAFNATLSTVWNGSTFPTLYAGNLPMADGNVGPTLSNSTHMSAVQDQLDGIASHGIPGGDDTGRLSGTVRALLQQPIAISTVCSFYAQVATTIRAMGMKIIVENDELLSSDTQAGWTNTAAFFSTLQLGVSIRRLAPRWPLPSHRLYNLTIWCWPKSPTPKLCRRYSPI